MTPARRISVIIPTYQRCASVQRTLQALARQTLPPDQYEVIVSIDGSEDGTREMVEQFSSPYKLQAIWQPNGGRAAACNAGIRAARGDLLILLDDDMEPVPDFLAAHQRVQSGGSCLGVMGAVPITVDRGEPPIVEYIGSKFNAHLDKLAQPDYQLKLWDFYSGNFSIRRDTLLGVGTFDEAFKIYGNEDLELALRLSHAGVRLVYSREALARQYYTKDFAAFARDSLAEGRTAVLLVNKHPNAFHELKLSTYDHVSRKWRGLRAGLLGLSQVWPRTSDWVILFMKWLERRRPAQLDLYYSLAWDYFYWLGAKSALHENRKGVQYPPSVTMPSQEHKV